MPIDLCQVKTPVYMFATKEDHIAPWASCYPGTQAFAGPKSFMLGASGHIAGRDQSARGQQIRLLEQPAPAGRPRPMARGRHLPGRLLVARLERLARPQGRQEGARPPARATGRLAPLEDAPGSYVKVRASE